MFGDADWRPARTELAAAGTGALIRINTREPDVRHGFGVALPLAAAAALTALAERLDRTPGSTA
jgi:hypothetical protein